MAPASSMFKAYNYVRAASAVIINSEGENFIYTSTLRPGAGRQGPAQAGEAENALSTMSIAIGLPTAAACVRSCTLSLSSSMPMRVLSSRSGL